MSNTITLPLVDVLIIRSNDMQIPARVPEHEVAVLRAVHGSSNVRPLPQEEFPEEREFDISADQEFGRLQKAYARINDPDRVLQAYPMGASMLQSFGFQLHRGEYTEAPASEQIDFAREERIAKGKAKKAAAEKEAAAKGGKKD